MSSVDKTLQILFRASTQGEFRVTDAARELDLDKGTVSRLSKKLVRWGLLEQDPVSRSYRLGSMVAWLGASYLARQDLRQLARPLLIQLSQKTERTVGLVMLNGRHGVFLDKVESNYWVGISANIGEQLPLFYRASCKAILAFLPENEIEALFQEAPEFLPSGRPFDRKKRKAELAIIRSCGYAISREEVDFGVTGIGAPIFDAEGKVVAGISVATASTAVSSKQDEVRLAENVCATANAIAKKLGYVGVHTRSV